MLHVSFSVIFFIKFRMSKIPRNRFLSQSKISYVSVSVSVQVHLKFGES